MYASSLYKLLFDYARDIILFITKDGRIIDANQAALSAYGYAYEEILTKSIEDLRAGDLTMLSAQLEKAYDEGASYETIHKRKDGTIFNVEVNARGIKDSEKPIVMGIVRDVTDRKRSEAELIKSNKELIYALDQLKRTQSQLISQEKLAAIGQLAAGIAHEINNPLGYIISNSNTLAGYLEKYRSILERYRRLKDMAYYTGIPDIASYIDELDRLEQEKNIDFIQEDIEELFKDTNDGLERIGKIVRGLRVFSRNDQEDQFEEYDLNAGIQNTLVIARNEIKYHAGVMEEYEELPLIKAVGGQVNQVLLNIIINAVHAIEAKDREEMGQIAIRTYHDKDYVYCDIEDNGTGISTENIDKLFQPFFTTKMNGKGTGLGLWISHDIIINKHKGDILVESIPGKGTKFTIKLPIMNSAADERQ